MKQNVFTFSCIFFFLIMITLPSLTLSGATNGLLLWFQIILPTLLPYFIVVNFLIQTNSITYITNLCHPVLTRLFRVSPNGSFTVLIGFLCGYPVGAKVTADLIRQNKISLNEGKYLLSFCNNTSPAFIGSYLVLQIFKDNSLMLPTLIILYTSPVICSFLFRRIYSITNMPVLPDKTFHKSYFTFEIFDECIMNAFENITKIGGYIILFSILLALTSHMSVQPYLAILEITNGISLLIKTNLPFFIQYTFIMALTSFGGFCAIAQTNSMIQGSGLSIFSYILEKLITSLVTSLLSLLYVLLILR